MDLSQILKDGERIRYFAQEKEVERGQHEGTTKRVTELLYCPTKTILRNKHRGTEFDEPFEMKLRMLKGTAVHEYVQDIVRAYDNEYHGGERFIIEKRFHKTIEVGGEKFDISGQLDIIDRQEKAIIELKNYGRYSISADNFDSWKKTQEKVYRNIMTKLPTHYVDQMIIYSWLTGLKRVQLILITDIGIVQPRMVIDDNDGLKVKILKSDYNDEYYLYALMGNFGPKLNKTPDKENSIKNLEQYVKEIVKRHLLLLKFYESGNPSPVHKWECGFCYFNMVGLCSGGKKQEEW